MFTCCLAQVHCLVCKLMLKKKIGTKVNVMLQSMISSLRTSWVLHRQHDSQARPPLICEQQRKRRVRAWYLMATVAWLAIPCAAPMSIAEAFCAGWQHCRTPDPGSPGAFNSNCWPSAGQGYRCFHYPPGCARHKPWQVG